MHASQTLAPLDHRATGARARRTPGPSTPGPSTRAAIAGDDRSATAGTPRLGWRPVGWLVAYAVGLGIADYWLVAPLFAYLGFDRATPNVGVVAVLATSYVLCARRLPATWERPSSLVYWMLFVLVVAPVHVLPVFSEQRTAATWTMVFSIAVVFWGLGLIYDVRPVRIPRPALPAWAYWLFVCMIWAGLVGTVLMAYGVHLRWVSLSEVYEVRDVFRESLDEVPTLAQYAVTWVGGVFAPLGIAHGMFHRRYAFVVAGVASELFLVSITGFKSLLFSSVLVAGLVVLVKVCDIRAIGRRLAPGLAIGVVIVFCFDMLTGRIELSSLFIRRMILTAGINTEHYFSYFSHWPKAHLGNSVLEQWVDYPYAVSPAKLIGRIFYGSPETSANANLWADAFSNFGLPGVFAFTVILAGLLYLLDSTAIDLPPGIPLIVFAMPTISLSNSAMLTTFVTHGFLVALLLVMLMPRDGRDPPDRIARPDDRRATSGRHRLRGGLTP